MQLRRARELKRRALEGQQEASRSRSRTLTLTQTLTLTLTLTLAQMHTATINPNPNETPQELDERIARIQGDGADAWADSFVQNFLSPKGNFASERETGAYPPTKLPTRSDPL